MQTKFDILETAYALNPSTGKIMPVEIAAINVGPERLKKDEEGNHVIDGKICEIYKTTDGLVFEGTDLFRTPEELKEHWQKLVAEL